jgi:tetratricopeptide (TPR) repeat protein
MRRSLFGRLVDMINGPPPPEWARRDKKDSVFSRMWNALAPPPPAHRSDVPIEQRRGQRRLVLAAAFSIPALALGWWGFSYWASAPQRSAAELKDGMKYMAPGSYPRAIATFDRALRISPSLAEAYVQRGIAYTSLAEPDKALADFRKALQLNPNLTLAHNGISTILRERGDAKGAFDELTSSINIAPNEEAYYQRGQMYEQMGDHKHAIADYDKAIELHRDSPFVYRARALAKLNLGDVDGAREDRAVAKRIEHVH